LETQDKELIELHAVISVLEERLRSVRNPQPCDPSKTENAPMPVRVDAVIDRHSAIIGAATRRLNDLISELVV
jgi:hypothetical protein